jgi:hypothetical protein
MQASITYNQTCKDIKRKARKLASKKIKRLKNGGSNNESENSNKVLQYS